jgi:hypothetical protein
MKKVGTPFILMLECSGMLLYFWRMAHDPDGTYWHNYGWTVLYDSAMMLPLCLLSLLFSVSTAEERGAFDKYFLFIIVLFTFTINMAVVAQYYNLIAHTYGLQVSIVGIIVATVMVLTSIFRHGTFKD